MAVVTLLMTGSAGAQSNEELGLDTRRQRRQTKPLKDHLVDLPGTIVQLPLGVLALSLSIR